MGGGFFFVAGAAEVLGVFTGLAAVNSLPHPAGGLGDAPLELAGVFSDEEWEVPSGVEGKIGCEKFLEAVERSRLAKRLAAAEPLGFGRVFLEPGAGGGDDQLATGRE